MRIFSTHIHTHTYKQSHTFIYTTQRYYYPFHFSLVGCNREKTLDWCVTTQIVWNILVMFMNFSVLGPHFIWQIDGHDKLKKIWDSHPRCCWRVSTLFQKFQECIAIKHNLTIFTGWFLLLFIFRNSNNSNTFTGRPSLKWADLGLKICKMTQNLLETHTSIASFIFRVSNLLRVLETF